MSYNEKQPATNQTRLWLLVMLLVSLLAAFFYVQIYLPLDTKLHEQMNVLAEYKRELATLRGQLALLEEAKAQLAAEVDAREKELEELVGAQEEIQERLYSELARDGYIVGMTPDLDEFIFIL